MIIIIIFTDTFKSIHDDLNLLEAILIFEFKGNTLWVCFKGIFDRNNMIVYIEICIS